MIKLIYTSDISPTLLITLILIYTIIVSIMYIITKLWVNIYPILVNILKLTLILALPLTSLYHLIKPSFLPAAIASSLPILLGIFQHQTKIITILIFQSLLIAILYYYWSFYMTPLHNIRKKFISLTIIKLSTRLPQILFRADINPIALIILYSSIIIATLLYHNFKTKIHPEWAVFPTIKNQNPPSDSESQDGEELITYTLLPIESTTKTNNPTTKNINLPPDSEPQEEEELITYTLLPRESTIKTHTSIKNKNLLPNSNSQNNENQITYSPLARGASARTPTHTQEILPDEAKPSTSKETNYTPTPYSEEPLITVIVPKNLNSSPTYDEYESIAGNSILYSSVQHPITNQPTPSQSSTYQTITNSSNQRRKGPISWLQNLCCSWTTNEIPTDSLSPLPRGPLPEIPPSITSMDHSTQTHSPNSYKPGFALIKNSDPDLEIIDSLGNLIISRFQPP